MLAGWIPTNSDSCNPVTSKATMCFEINRYANHVPIPKQLRGTPYQGFGEPKITGRGRQYVNDHVWNQQDGSFAVDTPRPFPRRPTGYQQSHDVSWNERIRKLRSRPQGRANADRRPTWWPIKIAVRASCLARGQVRLRKPECLTKKAVYENVIAQSRIGRPLCRSAVLGGAASERRCPGPS
jgi:hypothetical protein